MQDYFSMTITRVFLLLIAVDASEHWNQAHDDCLQGDGNIKNRQPGSCELTANMLYATSLLQSSYEVNPAHREVITSALTSATDPGFVLAKPLTWLHVPKCGSSLMNALVRVGCHGFNDVWFSVETMGDDFMTSLPADDNVTSHCPGLTITPPFLGSHHSIGSDYEQLYRGHGVTMLRQPEQRAISMFNYGGSTMYENHSEMLASSAGCVVRMLTMNDGGSNGLFSESDGGCSSSHCWGRDAPVPTQRQVEVAKDRLREFAFVGLTEEWDLSMCLFHAIFGGECAREEFLDSRPSEEQESPSNTLYDTSVLEGVTDPYDGEIYALAQSLFDENLRSYSLSHEACQPCYDMAGVSS